MQIRYFNILISFQFFTPFYRLILKMPKRIIQIIEKQNDSKNV